MKKILFTFGAVLLLMVVFSQKSFALSYSYTPNTNWPGTYWSGKASQPVTLAIEYAVNGTKGGDGKYNVIHVPNSARPPRALPSQSRAARPDLWYARASGLYQPDLSFAVFKEGDTRGVPGSFAAKMIIPGRGGTKGNICDLTGTGVTLDMNYPENSANIPANIAKGGNIYIGSGGNGFNCDTNPEDFLIPNSSGVYDPNTNVTKYKFEYWLNIFSNTTTSMQNSEPWGVRGLSFQFQTSEGTPDVIQNGSVAFIGDMPDSSGFFDYLQIPQASSNCKSQANTGTYTIYDSDNNANNAAQKSGSTYVPMGIALYDILTDANIAADALSPATATSTPDNYYNFADANNPNIQDYITYSIVGGNSSPRHYNFRLKDIGTRNYTYVNFPFDGESACASANINADAGGGGGAGVGSTFTFTGWVDVTNAVRTAGKTFGWSNVSTGPNPAGPATGGNAPIADGRQVADVQPVYLPTRGTYERTITVTSVPDLGSGQPVVTGSPSKQTITVVGWDTHVDSSMSGPANAGISADGKKMTILKGQSVTFNHHAYTTGDPLHTNIDVNILRHGSGNDFGPTNVSGNPCEDVPPGGTTCNTYRYDSANLSPGASDKTGSRTYTFSNTGKYCEYAWYSMAADNAGASDNSAGMICVYIVDPRPVATHIEYEKNPSGMDPGINMLVSFPAGSYCPEAGGPSITFHYGYNINFAAKIPGLADKAAGNIPVTYAAGSCADASIEVKINKYTEATKLNDINVLPGTTINYSISLLENGLTDTNTITVVEIPFSRFYGNDIYSKNGPIVFNTKSFGPGGDDTSFGAGSGSQYAAIANSLLGPATGDDRTRMPLDTALFRVDTAPFRTGGLKASVAGERQPKPGSIFDNLPSSATGGSVNWAADGFYDYGSSNDATNLTPSNVSVSKKVTVRAKDILITNNITTASFTSLETAPVVLLVAEGDIYIDKSVTQIDAILLAPNGTIHTCSSAATKTLVNAVDWEKTPANGGCRNKLVINGAVGAGNIVYNRTLGSRMMSSDAEGSGADANTGMAVPAPPLLFGLTGTPAYTTDIYGYVVDKSMLNYGSYYDYYRLGVVSPALTNDVNNRIKTAKNITPISTSIAVKPVGKSGSLQVDVKYSYLPSQGTNPGKPGTPIPKPPVITPPVIITPPIVAPDPMKTSAEVVKFPAYLYYATPFLKDTGENGWESIFSGPPLL